MSQNEEPTLLAVVERVIDVISDAISNLLGQVVGKSALSSVSPLLLLRCRRSQPPVVIVFL